MGAFSISIGLGHPHSGDLREVEAVVDTGAIDSMVPASLLEQLHVQPLWSIICVLADGSEREYGRGIARIAIEDGRSPLPRPFRQRRLQVPARGYGPRDFRPHGRPRRAAPRPSLAQSSQAPLRPPPQDSVASPPSSAPNHPSPLPPTFTPCQLIRTNVPYRRAPNQPISHQVPHSTDAATRKSRK